MERTPEFLKLQKEWYGKLRKSGFDDIEAFGPEGEPYDILRYKFERLDPQGCADDEEYYRVARQFLNDFPFRTRIERKVWNLHSEGFSYRDISKSVRKTYWKVFELVNILKECMIKGIYGENRAEEFYTRTGKPRGRIYNKGNRRKLREPGGYSEESSGTDRQGSEDTSRSGGDAHPGASDNAQRICEDVCTHRKRA